MRRAFAATAIVGLAAFALAACAPAAAAPSARTVAITIHYSRVRAGRARRPAGRDVRFVIRNTDPIDHEFILGDERSRMRTSAGPRPTTLRGPARSRSRPGETVRTTYTFGEDDLLFGCHIPGHWAYGMRGIVLVG